MRLLLYALMCTYTCMRQDNRQQTAEYNSMAEAAIGVLDTRFLKALTDPTRIQIVKRLILMGANDVGTIASGLSQDRSVISRHLNTLEQARITASRKIGRRVFYDIDGPYVVEKVSHILEALGPMAELCVPFEALDTGEAA